MNLSNYDRIEAYLFDLLSATEKNAFEAELATNTELQEQLNLHRLEHEAIQLLEEDRIRAQFAEWKQELMTTPEEEPKLVPINRTRTSWRYRIGIAASLLLLLTAGSFWWATQTYSNQALANATFEEVSIVRSDAAISTRFSEALQEYKAQNYDAAISIYQQIIAESTNNSERDQAELNLIAAQLAKGETAPARQALKRIAQSPNHTYQKEATTLLSKLDSIWRKLLRNS